MTLLCNDCDVCVNRTFSAAKESRHVATSSFNAPMSWLTSTSERQNVELIVTVEFEFGEFARASGAGQEWIRARATRVLTGAD